MTQLDLLYMNAANYPYQKQRADAHLRAIIGLLLTNGPARISPQARALADGPLSDFEVIVQDDPPTGDQRLSVVRRRVR